MGNVFGNGAYPLGPPVAPIDGQENGQWNFISHGTSSFHDGTNQYTGSHMYSNINVSTSYNLFR